MTHRKEIQSSIAKLQEVYDTAGKLRDHSTPQMQKEYNNVRRALPTVWEYFQIIDNNLISDEMAKDEV